MKLLILLLLSPTIFSQSYRKSSDPNDEPFLPIYPVYPYSPKLIKRGTDRDVVTQLTPELHTPKVDTRDSYMPSISSVYQRDPHYPNYTPYPKSTSSNTFYTTAPYTYSTLPYGIYNSYSSSPYVTPSSAYTPAYSTIPYPNYFYQPPYYYPGYYDQPLLLSPPPPPPNANNYSPVSDTNDEKSKTSSKNQQLKDESGSQDSSGNQFIDGGNYLSSNSKDLDGQSSTYKVISPYNQVEQLTDLKNIPVPLPKTTYRVVSVAGQPVGPDYPLPAAYVKAQQLEQLMTQTLAKLLAQNTAHHVTQVAQYPSNNGNQQVANDGSYVNQNTYTKDGQTYITVPIAKTGLSYVVNPSVAGKVHVEQVSQPQVLTRTQNQGEIQYRQNPLTRINLDKHQSGYIQANRDKIQSTVQSTDYDNYDNSPAQNYEGSVSQTGGKQVQSYTNDQGQNQNYVTPQTYSYQYRTYNPTQTQSQQYKTNLEDVNFGDKEPKKG